MGRIIASLEWGGACVVEVAGPQGAVAEGPSPGTRSRKKAHTPPPIPPYPWPPRGPGHPSTVAAVHRLGGGGGGGVALKRWGGFASIV